MATLFQEKYIKEVVPAMQAEFGYKNKLAVPKIDKVSVNVGIGRITKDQKLVDFIKKNLTLIVGHKITERPAKKAIAAFKTREGMIVGLSVTLRGARMYDFLAKLINVALPRTRDFRGINPKSVDAKGNLTLGLKEHIVFPEIIGEEVSNIFGFEVSIATTAETREEGLELLKLFGVPFKKDARPSHLKHK